MQNVLLKLLECLEAASCLFCGLLGTCTERLAVGIETCDVRRAMRSSRCGTTSVSFVFHVTSSLRAVGSVLNSQADNVDSKRFISSVVLLPYCIKRLPDDFALNYLMHQQNGRVFTSKNIGEASFDSYNFCQW